MPKPKKSPASPPSGTASDAGAGVIVGNGPVTVVDPDSQVAHALQPLLEQEALVESFIEVAKSQRRFEDVKTLKVNLQEIRTEIERIVSAAGGPTTYKARTP